MAFFAKRKKPLTAQLDIKHPLDVRLVRADGVDEKKSNGSLMLRRKVVTKNSALSKIAEKLKLVRYHTVELDDAGCFFWSCIDGTVTIRSIADRLAQRFERDKKECEDACMIFTRVLMVKYFIYLKVDRKT